MKKKCVSNVFRLKKIDGSTIKNKRNLFRLRKENETIKGRIIRDTRNHFDHEEEDYD